MLNNIRSISS